MIRKKVCVIGILLMLLFCSTVSLATETQKQHDRIVQSSSNGATFIMGTIISPRDINGTTSAKALHLFYYDHGLFVEHFGIVRGFSTIIFEPTPFLFIYSPGPIGLIKYVIGFCKDFDIE
jgi:hypothetical protein